MLPNRSSLDLRNQYLGHTVVVCESDLSKPSRGSDLPYFDFSQFCSPVFFSTMVSDSRSPLVQHVPIIVLNGSSPQMGRIYARRVIAGMTDQEAFGNCSVSNRPAESVRKDHSSFCDESAVSLLSNQTVPAPTCFFGTFGNLAPKALFEGKLSISHDDLLGVNVVRDRSGNLGLLRPVNSNRMDA